MNLYIVFAVLAFFALFVAGPFVYLCCVANKQFTKLLVRTDKKKWSRDCSIADDEEQVKMYSEGLRWKEVNEKSVNPVGIVNEGMRLFGEYFDFGYNRAVIIIAGRTEGLKYSYYFASPYKEAGYNVLVIDNRSHGESDGTLNSLGLVEYRDVLAWARFLHDELYIRKVVLHGICIGSATALYAVSSPDCPQYLEGLTAEGMYTSFKASFAEHVKEEGKPTFPFVWIFFRIVKKRIGVDAAKKGPEAFMKDLNPSKRILMLHSKEDLYSLPEKAYAMFETCGVKEKRFVWFDHGRHSFVRINNCEAYDRAIREFWR